MLGVPADVVTEEDVLGFAEQCLREGRPARVVTVNAEFVMRAQHDQDFLSAIGNAALATPDGAGVVWAMRRQGARIRERVGGSDLIWSLSLLAARLDKRVFLLGAAPGVAERAAAMLVQRIPNLVIAGTHAGSPAREEEVSIADLIRRAGTDILFVAFGAPAQDVWLERNLGRTGAVVGIGVGGSFDYVAGVARRAPTWMQRHGLDWLWRLARQPYRWKRMLVLPIFAWRVWREVPKTKGRKS